jgi:CubicO group peptidase (beta-lactamase class C family)
VISELIDVGPQEPGIAVAVIRNGEVIAQHCAGLADLAHGVPIRPDTRFHIVSVSKTFMAAAVLLLQARGKLSLDDDIRKHLPELRHPGVVTIRHLLSLTSGLRDVLEIERLRGVWHSAPSRQQDLLHLASAQTGASLPPGAAYLYTNVNHVLLEQIVARASGMPADAFRRAAIYQPLGMAATCARPDDGIVLPNLAQPYARDGDGWVRAQHLLGIAGDVLTSSLEDMTRWLLALRTGAVDGVPITAAMSERARLSDGSAVYYGLGLAVRCYRGLTVLCHSGSQPGYKAHIAFMPERDLGIVVLSNREETRVAPLAASIMDAVLGDDFPAPMPRSVGVVDSGLAGTYVDPASGEYLSLSVEDGVLRGEALGDTVWLYRGADGIYRDADDYRATMPAELGFTGQGTCRFSLGGLQSNMRRHTPSQIDPGRYIGRYENTEIGSLHHVTSIDGRLFIHYGLGFEGGRRFPMFPVAPDIFLVQPAAPGIAYRHVFRFERDAFVVTMERLKGVRLSKSSP